jgi:hypothetical protein
LSIFGYVLLVPEGELPAAAAVYAGIWQPAAFIDDGGEPGSLDGVHGVCRGCEVTAAILGRHAA